MNTIGKSLGIIGWNTAKELGDTSLAYCTSMRVEAVGFDWVVLRSESGRAYSAAFDSDIELGHFLSNVDQ